MVEKEKLKIKMTDYSHSCTDGCCLDYGTITEVNGHTMAIINQDAATILECVLEFLGYEVDMELETDYN
jgi:hypothetical protein